MFEISIPSSPQDGIRDGSVSECLSIFTSGNVSDEVSNVNKYKHLRRPKSPLSGYNSFFQMERTRILNGDNESSSYTNDDINQVAPPYKLSTDKRRHRKPHGKIAFADLARPIGARWKHLDNDVRSIFVEKAKAEKMMHHKELRRWEMRNYPQSKPFTEQLNKKNMTCRTTTKDFSENESIKQFDNPKNDVSKNKNNTLSDVWDISEDQFFSDNLSPYDISNIHAPHQTSLEESSVTSRSSEEKTTHTKTNNFRSLDSAEEWREMVQSYQQRIRSVHIKKDQVTDEDLFPNYPSYYQHNTMKSRTNAGKTCHQLNQYYQHRKPNYQVTKKIRSDDLSAREMNTSAFAKNFYEISYPGVDQVEQYTSIMYSDNPFITNSFTKYGNPTNYVNGTWSTFGEYFQHDHEHDNLENDSLIGDDEINYNLYFK